MSYSNSATLVAPAFLTVPELRVSSAGQEAVELAASVGLVLDPWQVQAVDVILSERADGKWAAREAALLVPRQNGKGAILEAIELAALFLFGESLITHSAHEHKTAMDAFRRVSALIMDTPDLMRLVKPNGIHRAHGSEGIELRSGQRLNFATRTGGAGRGLPPGWVILDEAYRLDESAVDALIPSQSAQVNPLTIYTSSAPIDGDPRSNVLRRIGKRGRSGDPTLAYIEYCADLSADLDDPADAERLAAELDDPAKWEKANPSFNIVRAASVGIGTEAIQTERRALTPRGFARERLGVWDALDTDDDRVISAADWMTTCKPESQIDGPATFALEVAEFSKWSAFGAAAKSSLGNYVHGEVVDYRRGTEWVVERAQQLTAVHGGSIAIVKGSPAAAMISELKRAGVAVREVSTEDHARACGQFLQMIADRTFVHLDDPALTVAVRLAERRDFGDGGWVWSRKKSSVDIAPLVAVTVAASVHSMPTDKPQPFLMTLGGR